MIDYVKKNKYKIVFKTVDLSMFSLKVLCGLWMVHLACKGFFQAKVKDFTYDDLMQFCIAIGSFMVVIDVLFRGMFCVMDNFAKFTVTRSIKKFPIYLSGAFVLFFALNQIMLNQSYYSNLFSFVFTVFVLLHILRVLLKRRLNKKESDGISKCI